MAVVVGIVSGRDVIIHIRVMESSPVRVSQHCLSYYFTVKSFKTAVVKKKAEGFSYKGGCGRHRRTRIKPFKRRAGLGCR